MVKKKVTDGAAAADEITAAHLITDYSGMKEDSIVSAAWIDAGFSTENFSEMKVLPVGNLSRMEYARAQERIESGLREGFEKKKKNPSGRTAVVTSALTAMRGKPGFTKWFSPTYEDVPSIELEVVITDAQSGRELAKFSHMTRGKEPDLALERLLSDLSSFITKKL